MLARLSPTPKHLRCIVTRVVLARREDSSNRSEAYSAGCCSQMIRLRGRSLGASVALRILSVPSWHTPSERKIEAPKTHSLLPFHLRSPLLGLHLAPSSLLPVIWGRTPKHRGSDRLNLSFGSSNRRCTPPIVCSNPARAPRGARALLLLHCTMKGRLLNCRTQEARCSIHQLQCARCRCSSSQFQWNGGAVLRSCIAAY